MKKASWPAIALLGCWVAATAGQESTWPQWRGPSRDGQFSGPAWPDSLQKQSLKLLWRVSLGPSYSGPIVSADRVFVTETINKTNEVVRALDRATGKEQWRVEWEGATTVPSYARGNGEWIRSTPAFDGAFLFVAGMRDVLVCLDAATGQERWRVDFVALYKTPLPPYGFACSPLADGDAIFVQAAAALVKLDKRTGKVLWRVLPYKSSANGTAVSSPVLATLAGKRQLLVQQPRLLAGIDPETGAVLWKAAVPAFRNTNIMTPVVYKDSVLTSAFGGRTSLFAISRRDDVFDLRTAWTNKDQGYMSTPVVIDDHAYMHLRSDRVTCLDLRTGKNSWTTDKRFGRYWSMIAHTRTASWHWIRRASSTCSGPIPSASSSSIRAASPKMRPGPMWRWPANTWSCVNCMGWRCTAGLPENETASAPYQSAGRSTKKTPSKEVP
jgi:outer membrane protein assembly factor BamB